jgi:hypothetical protein
MKKIFGSHIIRTSDEIRRFSTDELTAILFNSVIGNKKLETLILEFNKDFQLTTFHDSLAFELEMAIMKHCCPIERTKWEKSFRIPWIMIDIDNDPYSIQINSIMNDFVNLESKRSMKRILIKKDIMTGGGNVLKNMSVFDFSIVDSHDQFDNYKSSLFEVTNHDLIKHYYRDFLHYFALTLAEFERVFFFFLTFLTEKEHPLYTEPNDICTYKKEINEILRMRYIDIHDKVIMALIHIIYSNPELHNISEDIFNEIKDIEDLTNIQCENLAS